MQDSHPKNENNIHILNAQVRECFGRVVYSHKTHLKCSDILLDQLATIKIWQIILSALTTGGFIATLIGDNKWGAIAGVIISTLLLIINAYTKNYDLGEIAQKHKQAANELWLIRERYLSLLTDIAMEVKPIESILSARDELMDSLHKVYTGAPATNYKAYSKARDALKNAEELTFSDAEIDAFLPQKLRNEGS